PLVDRRTGLCRHGMTEPWHPAVDPAQTIAWLARCTFVSRPKRVRLSHCDDAAATMRRRCGDVGATALRRCCDSPLSKLLLATRPACSPVCITAIASTTRTGVLVRPGRMPDDASRQTATSSVAVERSSEFAVACPVVFTIVRGREGA